MVSRSRWVRAQEYERGYWANQAQEIANGATAQMDWYKWRADQLLKRLDQLGLQQVVNGAARVVEVGSGPIGVAGFFPAADRLLVDPLENFYASNQVLTSLRNPAAEYRQGGGEKLPAESGVYDLAIIENCIDHVNDADAVMRELVRVLRPGGVLYLTVNCRCPSGYFVHRLLSRLRLDPGHPYTFTPDRLRAMLVRHGLTVLTLDVGSYQKAREEDMRSSSSRARLKARLGISEFLASAIARTDA
jgi:SAM-dependent methyltransferase